MSAKAKTPIPIFVILACVFAVAFGTWISLEPLPIDSVFGSILSEPMGSTFGHALIALCIFAGLIVTAIKRRVLPLPQVKLLMPLAVVELAIAASVLMTSYKHVGLIGLIEWTTYGAALILTVGTVGRGNGVRWVLGAIAGVITLMALYGIMEYVSSAQNGNPSWRIFAHTMGPNVAAAFFGIGLLCWMGLVDDSERLVRLLCFVGAFLCAAALFFTGSKGGVLATGIGAIFFVIQQAATNRKFAALSAGAALGMLLLGFGFTTVATARFSTAGGPTINRIAGAGATAEQSAGFRQLLWKGAAKLIAEKPIGYGIGAYRYYSAKPGLTTQTQLAHDGYLQLAVEASPVALLGFIAFLWLLAAQVFRGSRGQPEETRTAKAAVAAAIAMLAIHSVFESNFQIFGLGILFFVLCGLAIQLSTDSSAPEFMQASLRNGLLVAGVLASFAFLYLGWIDIQHGLILADRGENGKEAVVGRILDLEKMAPFDARVFYSDYRIEQAVGASAQDQVVPLRKALELGPTPSMLREMARLAAGHEEFGSPFQYLDRALALDPNNLPALSLTMQLAADTDPARAKAAAERLVAVEETPYFKTRSIPEIVPLETYLARIYLAQSLSGAAKTEMLRPAVLGFTEFAKITVPKVAEFKKAGLDGGFGRITVADAKASVEMGQKLVETYRSASGGDKEADVAASAFEEALASLSQ